MIRQLADQTGSKELISMKNMTQDKAYEKGIGFQFVEPVKLGPIVSYSLRYDPIHLSFVLARYKFVARILGGKKRVLEIGCGDAFGTPIVAQFVEKLLAIDIDARLIQSNKERLKFLKNVEVATMEFGRVVPAGKFDAIFAVDVIEHVDPQKTEVFFNKISQSLEPHGVCLLGTPNIKAKKYASPQSAIQHINTKVQDHVVLKDNLSGYFHNLFLFGMNDEVVHTGFLAMAHYLWALGVGAKS